MQRVQVTIEGATPILFNRLPPEELLAIRNGERKKKRFKAVVTPREECEKKVYITKDDKWPYVPGKMLWACLVNAGRFIKLDGKTLMSTATTSRLAGFITIEDHAMRIFDPTNPESKKAPQWEVDLEQGRNPNGGEVVCIIRPRFDVWAFRFNMLVDSEQIEMNKIRNLIDIAGQRVGLGDFRPQRKGTFGKFVVKCWEVEDLKTEAEAAE